MGKHSGRHRAARVKKAAPVVGAVGIVAAAGAAVVGLTPTLEGSPALMSKIYYLEGTKIGDVRSDPDQETFALAMAEAAGAAHSPVDYQKIVYPASIWPVSTGGFSDPKWDDSVATGLAALQGPDGVDPQSGDTIIGYSQGAVVASEYKGDNLGNGVSYVLIENPNRPNGGLLERFSGVHVPILDISFNGATPVVDDPAPGTGTTVDISRQYDGWSDFPAYPINLLADANAVLGIVYLHGDTQNLTNDPLAGIVTDPLADGYNPDYYQVHGDATYYLIPTQTLPLLMPFEGIVPKAVLDAADPPLRYLIELGYDRTDYSQPTPARLLPNVNPLTAATGFVDAAKDGIDIGVAESKVSTPAISPLISKPAFGTTNAAPKLNVPKPDLLTKITKITKPTTTTMAASTNPLSKKLTSSKATGSTGPVKAIKSALRNLAPKKQDTPSDSDSSGDS